MMQQLRTLHVAAKAVVLVVALALAHEHHAEENDFRPVSRRAVAARIR